MKKLIPISISIYAILLLFFGILGYLKAGSLMSLISGGTFAVLLGISALFIYRGRKKGFYSALLLSFGLTLLFLIRYLNTSKPFLGTFAVLSGLLFLGLFFSFSSWKKSV